MSDPGSSSRAATELSIVIPVFNESENLAVLLPVLHETLSKHGRAFEILVVDDGSSDQSAEAALNLKLTDVRVFRLHRNLGQTAALMAGIEHARGEVILPMDGDFQNQPSDIPRLLSKLDEGFDVVSGWRQDRKDARFTRNLPSTVANWLIGAVTGMRLHDYGCSLKAYRRSALKGVRLYGEMHRFVPLYAHWNGARVAELPVAHAPRRHGKSHYGLKRVPKVLLDLIVVVFLHRFAQKPMYIFGGAGLLCFAMSFLSALAALYYKFFGGKTFVETPLPIMVAMTFITGVMCVLLGLIAELLVRTYYESQGKSTYLLSELTPLADR